MDQGADRRRNRRVGAARRIIPMTPGKPNRVLSMKLESDLSDLSSAPARDLWSGRTSESSLVARRCQGQRGAAIRLDRLNELSNALGGSGSGSAETATG